MTERTQRKASIWQDATAIDRALVALDRDRTVDFARTIVGLEPEGESRTQTLRALDAISLTALGWSDGSDPVPMGVAVAAIAWSHRFALAGQRPFFALRDAMGDLLGTELAHNAAILWPDLRDLGGDADAALEAFAGEFGWLPHPLIGDLMAECVEAAAVQKPDGLVPMDVLASIETMELRGMTAGQRRLQTARLLKALEHENYQPGPAWAEQVLTILPRRLVDAHQEAEERERRIADLADQLRDALDTVEDLSRAATIRRRRWGRLERGKDRGGVRWFLVHSTGERRALETGTSLILRLSGGAEAHVGFELSGDEPRLELLVSKGSDEAGLRQIAGALRVAPESIGALRLCEAGAV